MLKSSLKTQLMVLATMWWLALLLLVEETLTEDIDKPHNKKNDRFSLQDYIPKPSNEYKTTGPVSVLQENLQTYVSLADLIQLRDIDIGSVKLEPRNTTASPNIKTTFQPVFQEVSQFSFPDTEFVDTFGFRLGNIFTTTYQVVILPHQINLYMLNATRATTKVTFQFIKSWMIDDLFTDKQKGYLANSTSGAMQGPSQTLDRVRFILLVKKSDGFLEQKLVSLNLHQKGYSINGDEWVLDNEYSLETKQMVFTNMSNIPNHSSPIPCQSSMKYLPNIDIDQKKDPDDDSVEKYYFTRYCKMSQLPFKSQVFYSNTIEIFELSVTTNPNNKNNPSKVSLLKVATLSQFEYNNLTYPIQVVSLKEFNNQLVAFMTFNTYVFKWKNYTGLKTAETTQKFGYRLMLGTIKCRQNDFDVLTCSQKTYNIKCEGSVCRTFDIYEYFVEFTKSGKSLTRVPPIRVSDLSNKTKIVSINSNFLIFKSNVSDSSTTLTFIQRGTTNNIIQQVVKDRVICTKRIGPPFIMYKKFDMGLLVKKSFSKNKSTLQFSLYTLNYPYFSITVGSNLPDSVCFNYTQNCQFINMIFSYRSLCGEKHYGALNYFHVNQNFSTLLPKVLSRLIYSNIIRDKFSVNLTDLVYGLPLTYHVGYSAMVPIMENSNITLTQDLNPFSDFNINITDFSPLNVGLRAGVSIFRMKFHLSQYPDGSFFIAVILILQQHELTFPMILEIPDVINTNDEPDFSISVTIMNKFEEPTNRDRCSNIWVVENEAVPGQLMYLKRLYREFENHNLAYYRACYTKEGLLKCEDEDYLPAEEDTNLSKVRIIRTKDSKIDDIIILFTPDKLNVFKINPVGFPSNIKPPSLLFSYKFNSKTQKLQDALAVNFNFLILNQLIADASDPSQTFNITQLTILDCLLKNSPPSCITYGSIKLPAAGTTAIFVNFETYNIVVVKSVEIPDPSNPKNSIKDIELLYYRIDLFEYDLLNRLGGELLPIKTIFLGDILQTKNIWLGKQISKLIKPVNSIFAFPVSKYDPNNKESPLTPWKILSFDFSYRLQGIKEAPSDKDMRGFNLKKGPAPYDYPMALSFDTDRLMFSIRCFNPSNGFTIRTQNSDYTFYDNSSNPKVGLENLENLEKLSTINETEPDFAKFVNKYDTEEISELNRGRLFKKQPKLEAEAEKPPIDLNTALTPSLANTAMKYRLVISNKAFDSLVISFQGTNRYDFNIYPIGLKTKANKDNGEPNKVDKIVENGQKDSLFDVISLARGFIETVGVFCGNDTEGTPILTRNQSICLECPRESESAPKAKLVFNSFLTKDFDFVPNNYLEWKSRNSYHPGRNYPGNLTDFFTLGDDEAFIVALHSDLSIIKPGNHSRVVAFLTLINPTSQDTIDYTYCLSVNQGYSYNLSQITIELLCKENPIDNHQSTSMYNVSLNYEELKKSITEGEAFDTLPLEIKLTPEKYELSNNEWYLSSVKNPMETQYHEGFFFVLNSIKLENYNNKTYLNIYKVQSNGNNVLETKMIWSSLSLISFSNFTIRKFQISRKEVEDPSMNRAYSVAIISQMEHVGSYLTVLDMNVPQNFSNPPKITPGDPYLFSETDDFLHIKLFSKNSHLHIFGFSIDTITEWISSEDLSSFPEKNIYAFYQICSLDSFMTVHKLQTTFILYCYNSTSNGHSDDIMMIFDTSFNRNSSTGIELVRPLFQKDLPDVDSPSTKILAAYFAGEGSGEAKILLSSSRSFISQYTIRIKTAGMRIGVREDYSGTYVVSGFLKVSNALENLVLSLSSERTFWQTISQYVTLAFSEILIIILILVYFGIFFLIKFKIKIKEGEMDFFPKKHSGIKWRQAEWLASRFKQKYEELNFKK